MGRRGPKPRGQTAPAEALTQGSAGQRSPTDPFEDLKSRGRARAPGDRPKGWSGILQAVRREFTDRDAQKRIAHTGEVGVLVSDLDAYWQATLEAVREERDAGNLVGRDYIAVRCELLREGQKLEERRRSLGQTGPSTVEIRVQWSDEPQGDGIELA